MIVFFITIMYLGPTSSPSSISIRRVGVTYIVIEWDEVDCLGRNGIVTSYRVRHGLSSTTSIRRNITVISDPNERTFTLNGLMLLTTYGFEVAAVNVHGTGPYSMNAILVTTAVPEGITITCPDTMIHVIL